MKIETFDEDAFELKEFAERLERFIEVEHDFVEDSLVLSLTSPFGSGKSTFLRMWKNHLLQNSSSNRPIVISLNAWEEDYCEDPLYAAVSAIVDEIGEESAENIIDAVKEVGPLVVDIIDKESQKRAGISLKGVLKLVKNIRSYKKSRVGTLLDAYSAYTRRHEAMGKLKDAIRVWIDRDVGDSKVLFLVDELDRCRPDYAISYLETIKHIFDIRGAVFILAVDRQQLESSAKKAFGYDLDFAEYYRKFVHREISLPPISFENYGKLASLYVSQYLRGGTRFCAAPLRGDDIDMTTSFISSSKLTPRQIQELFRVIGHFFSTVEQNHISDASGWLFPGTIFMAALRISNIELYNEIGTQKIEVTSAAEFIENLPFKDDFYGYDFTYFFAMLLSGGAIYGSINELDQEIAGNPTIRDAYAEGRKPFKWGLRLGDNVTSCFAFVRTRIEHIYEWI